MCGFSTNFGTLEGHRVIKRSYIYFIGIHCGVKRVYVIRTNKMDKAVIQNFLSNFHQK